MVRCPQCSKYVTNSFTNRGMVYSCVCGFLESETWEEVAARFRKEEQKESDPKEIKGEKVLYKMEAGSEATYVTMDRKNAERLENGLSACASHVDRDGNPMFLMAMTREVISIKEVDGKCEMKVEKDEKR